VSVSHVHDEVEQRLLSNLAMVNDWLKFAETNYTDVVHARSRDDLAAQIIVNSRITLAKPHLFGIATWFFAAAAVAALAAVQLSVVT
jgi:hypothetical protein